MDGDWVSPECREIIATARRVMGGKDNVDFQIRLLPNTNSDVLKRTELTLSLTTK